MARPNNKIFHHHLSALKKEDLVADFHVAQDGRCPAGKPQFGSPEEQFV
jgi:hypothetical protein